MRPIPTLGLGVLIFAGIAAASPAQTLMTAEDYEAFSAGQTLDYAIDGEVYGSERHLPDGRTLDADLGEPCTEGRWFAEGDAICFAYDGIDGTHCWNFWRDGDQVLTKPVGEDPAYPPREVTVSPTPLACPAPDVGV